MKSIIRILSLLALLGGLASPAFGQTEKEIQAADSDLNKAYQELIGKNDAAQKELLKAAQKRWISQRDAFVAANPGNPKRALYLATIERVVVLRNAAHAGKATPNTAPATADTTQQAQQGSAQPKNTSKLELPAAGSALRKTVLDGLRPAIEKDLNQKVIFVVNMIRVYESWAFVQVKPVQPNSKPIDFRKTKYKEAIDEGFFDGGGDTYALLRKEGERWVTLTFAIAPTDVCWDSWDKSPFNAPSNVLPRGGNESKKQNTTPQAPDSMVTIPITRGDGQDIVTPVTQSGGGRAINCTSQSEDGKLIAVGYGDSVDIWTKDFQALLRHIVCKVSAVKVYSSAKLLLVIGQPGAITGTQARDTEMVATYYNIENGAKVVSFILAGGRGMTLPYITEDGHHVILGQGYQYAYGADFLVLPLPDVDSTNKQISISKKCLVTDTMAILETKASSAEIKKLFPEIQKLIIRDRNDPAITTIDSEFASELTRKVRNALTNDDGTTAKSYAVSDNGTSVALLGRSQMRILEQATGIVKHYPMPDNVDVLDCTFSPDGSKIAVLCYNKDAAVGEASSMSEYRGIVIETSTGIVISNNSIPAENMPWICSYHSQIRWWNKSVYISNCAVFDSSFNFVKGIKEFSIPTSCFKSPVLVKEPEQVPEKDPSAANSWTVLSPLLLIDPVNLSTIGSLKYEAVEKMSGWPIIDISDNHKSLLRSWFYYRGGGGLFYQSNDKKEDFPSIDLKVEPAFASFLPNGNIICVKGTNGEAGSNEMLIMVLIPNPPQKSLPLVSVKTPDFGDIKLSGDSKSLYGIQSSGFLHKYSIDGSIIGSGVQYLSNKTNSLVMTPDHFYISHGNPHSLLRFTKGMESYPLEQFDLRLNRPDIVLDRLGAPKEAVATAQTLRAKRLKRMGVTEEMLKPDFHLPEVQIVSEATSSTSNDHLELQIKAADTQYPLDRLRVYVNSVPVNGRDGELLRDANSRTLEKAIPINLAVGRNKIQVSVLNNAGAESLYASADVTCTAVRPKPKLYAVAMGVSQYSRPEWCLKYAAKDASDLIAKIITKADKSYSEIKPLLLTDKDVTKESIAKIKEFLSGVTIDDTVLIFMAGHGILDDKYDYYFGTTDIDPASPSERGMPYEALDDILAHVPALKKILLMDTCHAGELDQDEKKELAAQDGSSVPIPSDSPTTGSPLTGKVAMRAIGTRGMTAKGIEGAKGKGDWYEKLQDMFVDLRRGSGTTVISSSQGAEYAFESSEQSNGLFTYSLMEAMDGKAESNKEGQITISKAGEYVRKRVQELTKGKQNPNLRSVNLEEDPSISTVK